MNIESHVMPESNVRTPDPYDGGIYIAHGELRGIGTPEWHLLRTDDAGNEVEAERISCTFTADNGLKWRAHIWDHVPAYQPIAAGDVIEGAYMWAIGMLTLRKPKAVFAIHTLSPRVIGLPDSPMMDFFPKALHPDTNIAVIEGSVARGKTPPRKPDNGDAYVVNFVMKTTTTQFKKPFTHYIPCEAWGTLEQVTRIYEAPEGSRWRIIGNVKTRRYDAPDGEIQKHTRIYCHRWTELGA